MTEIIVLRTHYTPTSIRGHLIVDDTHWGYTLEDALWPPGIKIAGQTAIPAGDYAVQLEMSKRFKKILPRILHVTGFTGVLFHGGNKVTDTDGCILIAGNRKAFDWIYGSLSDRLVAALQAVGGQGNASIINGPGWEKFLESGV